MLAASAVYGPAGDVLVPPPADGGERLLLARLPLLQEAGAAGASTPGTAGDLSSAASELAQVFGASVAADAAAGPATPYPRCPGGYCVEAPGWQMRLGFPLMERLGALSYAGWLAGRRRRVALAAAADGTWRGPVPPLQDEGVGWMAAAGVVGVGTAMAAAALAVRAREA